jgi:hypothetical protein
MEDVCQSKRFGMRMRNVLEQGSNRSVDIEGKGKSDALFTSDHPGGTMMSMAGSHYFDIVKGRFTPQAEAVGQ